jgi:Spy/CpxP family protein refolding chaperone
MATILRRIEMNSTLTSKLTATAFALVIALATTVSFAEDTSDAPPAYGPGYGMGPGMMGGYGGYGMGPGMMGGYGGYGMGPGMMGGYGGYGMGPGMMGGYGGYGMGPGMMGGYGPGYGMMGGYGGYGMGPGMMGYGGFYGLDLTDAQRTKIDKILDNQHKQHWSVMGGMMEAQNKLRDLYQADPLDAKKIVAVYGDIAKMQQQLIESEVEAQNQIRNVLTKEQRAQLRDWHRGGWGWGPRGSARDGAAYGPGGMMRR